MTVIERLIISVLFISVNLFSQKNPVIIDTTRIIDHTPRTVLNNAFQTGEYLHFSVNYGFITAGYATIEVSKEDTIRDRECYVLKTTARSHEAFDWIFKVRDKTYSYLDKERFHSLLFSKRLREGSYKYDVDVEFFQENGYARIGSKRYRDDKTTEKEKIIEVPYNVADALSALYYVRTMDLKVGDEYVFPAIDSKKPYDIKVIVHKREKIEVDAGEFDCFVVEPVMADGGVFKKDGKIMVWLTADDKKMPVKMSSKVYIGSIEAELDKYRISK
ncbi:MAG: DUF3108 domain-containing protein [Candidatus Delongbacteria bacterium]|nr:DUF3108 domain-containing protein [Candidatus Delongbacteria bacterium]MBN2835785.1 DUF3108 domain-containing protein [Candidatus Delongbacteria bacterium]